MIGPSVPQATRLVVDRWERGDLAEAVRNLGNALTGDEAQAGCQLCVAIHGYKYGEEAYPFYLVGEGASDDGQFAGMDG